jgi:hypothetical protein
VTASDAVTTPELSQWIQQRRDMEELIKQRLARSKLRMKKQAEKHRSERVFQVGDFVFLKLQPYVQASLAPRLNQKLAFKYFGPFRGARGCCCLQVGAAFYCLPSTQSFMYLN